MTNNAFYKPPCYMTTRPADQQTFFTLMAEVRRAMTGAKMPERYAEFLRAAEQITYREDYEELLSLAYDYVEIL